MKSIRVKEGAGSSDDTSNLMLTTLFSEIVHTVVPGPHRHDLVNITVPFLFFAAAAKNFSRELKLRRIRDSLCSSILLLGTGHK